MVVPRLTGPAPDLHEAHAALQQPPRDQQLPPVPLPPGGTPAAARSHPALWAAFILSGDIGPVPEGKE